MDADPIIYFGEVVFESKEAYFEVADSPRQQAFYEKFLELLEQEPDWHYGEIIHANLTLKLSSIRQHRHRAPGAP